MPPTSKTTDQPPSSEGGGVVESNVDIEKLRSSQHEDRRKLIKEWATRLAGRYPDHVALKAQLAGLFDDLDDYLSDEDLGSLFGFDAGDHPKDDSQRSRDQFNNKMQPPDPEAIDQVATRPRAQSGLHPEQKAVVAPKPLGASQLHADKPIPQPPNGIAAGADIGRLVTVSPGEVWQKSNFDIGSWLVDNPDVAKEVLGFELRKTPGGFSGGAPSIEDPSGRALSIVAQLDETSSDRLGEFVSRMATSRAQVGVWIVAGSRHEEVSAIGWLNGLGASIFLVQLQAARIANSPAAPLLTLITGPQPGNQTV